MNDTAIVFDNLTVSIDGNLILENVCAKVPKGSSTAIIGPNGAGKTTLLLALLGQIPYQGKIQILPLENGNSPRIAYVPQRLQFDRSIPLTVLEFMLMGIQKKPFFVGINRKLAQNALQLLSNVRAEKLSNRKIGALSGGEMQRVLLALAIQENPDLLILDEPAASVDFQGEYIFCELLEKLRKERNFTQLMVSHDLSVVTHHANHVICLNRKVAAEGNPKQVLTRENLTAIFGLHMGLADKNALPFEKNSCISICCSDKGKNENI